MHYTNAPVIINPGFQDTEDLGGLFSGYEPDECRYDPDTWQSAGQQTRPAPKIPPHQIAEPRVEFVGRLSQPPPTDPTLQDPHCVFQIVKRHFARYTPDLVEQVCGVPRDHFLKAAEAILENSGRERTTSFAYGVA